MGKVLNFKVAGGPVQPPPVVPPATAITITDDTKGGINMSQSGNSFVVTDVVPNPPPPSNVIVIGATVKASVTPTNVRSGPGGAPVVKAVASGDQGTVISGPESANGFDWWEVQFPDATGWVGFDSLTLVSGGTVPPVNPNPPPVITVGASFPGAQGSGAITPGGAGGQVVEVINLNDTGVGSFRAAVSGAGKRIVVFRLDGLIVNKSRIQVNNPNLTVYGRSAPGNGICLGGPQQSDSPLFVATDDCIVRDLSFDGSVPGLVGPDTGTVTVEIADAGCQRLMFDHLSMRWWGNKGFILYANSNAAMNDITMQRCLMYESNAAHPVGPMTDASSLAEKCTDIDFHHNMMINIGHRLPLWNTKSGRWQNNIAFNWDYFAALFQGATIIDLIGNAYLYPNTKSGNGQISWDGDHSGCVHPYEFTAVQSTDDSTQKMNGPASVYAKFNIGPQMTDPTGDQTKLVYQTKGEGLAEIGPILASWLRSAPQSAPKFPITEDHASLVTTLPLDVGNCQMVDQNGKLTLRRDIHDARVIAQFLARANGSFFTGQFTTPNYASSAKAYPSSLHDGISDVWKQAHQLDTSDKLLYNKISQTAGIPYIDCFMNGIVP